MANVKFANRIINAVYLQDDGQALSEIEQRYGFLAPEYLDDLANEFADDGDQRMANRCARAANVSISRR